MALTTPGFNFPFLTLSMYRVYFHSPNGPFPHRDEDLAFTTTPPKAMASTGASPATPTSPHDRVLGIPPNRSGYWGWGQAPGDPGDQEVLDGRTVHHG